MRQNKTGLFNAKKMATKILQSATEAQGGNKINKSIAVTD